MNQNHMEVCVTTRTALMGKVFMRMHFAFKILKNI